MRHVMTIGALVAVLCSTAVVQAGQSMELLYVTPKTGAVGGSTVPAISGQAWQGPGTRLVNGTAIYQGRPTDTLRGIAQQVYGNGDLWPLIFNANQHLLNGKPGSGPSTHVDLVIPPPPNNRVFQQGGNYYVQVRPGDTFRSLSQQLYGRDDLWRLLYQANRDIIESPQVAAAMAQHGSNVSLIFRVPDPNGTIPTQAVPNFGPQVAGTNLPSNYQNQSQTNVSNQTADPGRLAGTGRDIASLNLSGPGAIGRREAEIILRDTGFICSRNPTFERAMNALRKGHYGRGTTTLDQTNKERLFQLYQWYREALSKYGNYPTISSQATPQLYNQWVSQAAQQLTAVPANKREELMRSLMTTESGKTQWSNYTPVISNCGAVGFGQFLPATAQGVGINPFDPQQNIQGIGKYLNSLIKKHGLRKGLAAYNGGGNPPASSYAYADRILSRAGMR